MMKSMYPIERTEKGGWQLQPSLRRLTLYHVNLPSMTAGMLFSAQVPGGSSKPGVPNLTNTKATLLVL